MTLLGPQVELELRGSEPIHSPSQSSEQREAVDLRGLRLPERPWNAHFRDDFERRGALPQGSGELEFDARADLGLCHDPTGKLSFLVSSIFKEIGRASCR